jgi:hypothetical protein
MRAIFLSDRLRVRVSAGLSLFSSDNLTICLRVRLSACLSTCAYTYLSVCLSVCLSISTSKWRSRARESEYINVGWRKVISSNFYHTSFLFTPLNFKVPPFPPCAPHLLRCYYFCSLHLGTTLGVINYKFNPFHYIRNIRIENDASSNSFTVACVFLAFFTEPLPSNDRRIHIEVHGMMGGIYDVRHWHRLRCYDIHPKFHKDWFRHSKVDWGDIHRQHVARISLLLSFSK